MWLMDVVSRRWVWLVVESMGVICECFVRRYIIGILIIIITFTYTPLVLVLFLAVSSLFVCSFF